MRRPADMFDRASEWEALSSFVLDQSPGATLGVVSGRRRQGKSYLLQAVCEAAEGMYFAATEATAEESLRLLGEEIAAYGNLPAPPHFQRWEQAIDALLSLGRRDNVPVVLDEFPFLCKASPELPSVIQKAFGPRRAERLDSRCRLLLCGSAMSFMGKLLSGAAPLRGRAGLDLTVPTFDFRLAAEFWGLDDPLLAVKVHAIVGGTPAYRREYVRGDSPKSADDFDAWVLRTVLDPRSPLFKEARYLLAEEADLRDRALYHSVLAAVADGNHTRGGIANYVGRPDDVLGHPLAILEDSGFLVREEDAFHTARYRYRIAEPLIAFYHAIMRPVWARLERPGRGAQIWADSQDRFQTIVLGPHFERLARTWVRDFASAETLGAVPSRVVSAVINDPKAKATREVDVVAITGEGRRKEVIGVGEVKWGQTVGTFELERLREVRQLLDSRSDVVATQARLLLFSGAGFSDELRRLEKKGEVTLVDLQRLYHGE
jgi:uncharacterized protein